MKYISNKFNRFLLFLQSLRLSGNNIFKIHDKAFNGLNTLGNLDISINQLTSAPSLIDLRATLEVLNLSRNRIISIGDSYFYLCIKISEIYLDLNRILVLPNIQAISKGIVSFSLEGNNISLVNPMYGIYFPRLRMLHLARNQIESYCFPPRHFAPRLSIVFLDNNKLSGIHFPSVKSHSTQTKIFLQGNPWHCNSNLGWTEQCELQQKTNVLYGEVNFVGHDLCKSSPGTRHDPHRSR